MREKSYFVDGEVRIKKVMNINFTVDHRYVDGGKAVKMPSAFEKVFREPEAFIRKNFKPEDFIVS
jgi:pyruvate/2-oxoglutarate dehydrogenase complex dihydrolipoamide acyltransferase (E2) component